MANIDHLGIAVRSIEQAQRLYQALGLTVLKEEEEDEGVRSVMIPMERAVCGCWNRWTRQPP